MDRKKEGSETVIESESTKPTTKTTATTTTKILNTTNDDDTSSESFETWTLINDKEKCTFHVDSERVEILKNIDDEKEKHKEDVEKDAEDDIEEDVNHDFEDDPHLKMRDSSTDDLSDGISVISETPDEESQIRQRRQCGFGELQYAFPPDDYYRPLPPPTSLSLQLQKASTSLIQFSYGVTKSGLKCALYVGFGLAILGLLGNFHNFTWFSGVVNPLPSTDKLQENVNKLQLQNVEMRAEINSLQDQVNFLSKIQEKNSFNWREEKKFKAWSGNGDSLKPVDITKQDLKKPFKCPDGSFVEIANMCIEKQPANEPSIVDQFGQVLENLNEESQSVDENNSNNKNNFKENSNEWKKDKFGSRESYGMHSTDYDKKSKKRKNGDSNENKGEWMEKHMKNREQLRKKNKSNEDDDDSGEWRSDYMKEKEMRRKNNGNKDDSGEWHDKYMKNREKQRKQTEQKTKQYKNVKNY